MSLYQHVFVDKIIKDSRSNAFLCIGNAQCKYCGYERFSVRLNSEIEIDCLSDDEKIIKDIIE